MRPTSHPCVCSRHCKPFFLGVDMVLFGDISSGGGTTALFFSACFYLCFVRYHSLPTHARIFTLVVSSTTTWHYYSVDIVMQGGEYTRQLPCKSIGGTTGTNIKHTHASTSDKSDIERCIMYHNDQKHDEETRATSIKQPGPAFSRTFVEVCHRGTY